MSSVYEKEYKIAVQDFDFDNKLKLNGLFNYIQDIAAEHAEILGVGRHDLEKHDLFWVLSWIKVKVLTYPKFGDRIKVRTWPKKQHRLFSMRDLVFYTEDGEVFARVTTAWLLVNAKTMRATTIESLPIPIEYHASEESLSDVPEKYPALSNASRAFYKMIAYSDIDVNQHVNNAKYVEYMLDSYEADFFKEKTLKEISISFLAEAKFNDEVDIMKEISDSGHLHKFEAVNLNSKKVVFKAVLTF